MAMKPSYTTRWDTIKAGGANVLKATARVPLWGAAAMALTAGIGVLVGTTV